MGSRKTGSGVENVYAAAEKWVDCALRSDDSLFTPGKPIWTSQRLGKLRERFLDKHDEWKGPRFFEKLEPLLTGSPPEVIQLMAEAVYVTYLIVWKGATGRVAKQRRINQVLKWSPTSVAIPDELIDGLEPGIAHPGAFFIANFAIHPGFIIEFVEQWKEKDPDEQGRLLVDPWAFKNFVTGLEFRSTVLRNAPNSPAAQREALFHLVHPDTFEGIVSSGVGSHKSNIASASGFVRLVTEPTNDVDRRIQKIRRGLEAELGRDFDFYDPDIQIRVNTNFKPWDEFVRQAQEYVDTGQLESKENDYKRKIGEDLSATRDAVLTGADNWHDLLKDALRPSAMYRDLGISQTYVRDFKNWCSDHPEEALEALQALWVGDAERINAFSDKLPNSTLRDAEGARTNVISVLLMGLDVEQYPPIRVEKFKNAYRRTEYRQPEQGANEAELYGHALGFLDRFIEESAERGLDLRHRLDAQSVVWAISGESSPPPPPPNGPDLQDLAKELALPAEFLEEINTLLEDKLQVIFQGPPGTGKTYVAQKLARHLAGSEDRVTLVQFHPSYAYEDFVQGFRPTLENGQPGFTLRDGPLRKAADRARQESQTKHFLVIDEINRGNLARVFGELYFLLEYRDSEMDLQYSDEPFSLPDNLYIIGTMNTADRSIALVDLALRRRFYFVEFHPDDEPVKHMLRNWLKANVDGMEWVADVVDRANEKLRDDRHAAIGPSYFMKSGLDETAVKRIWKHSVLPYIEERLFGNEDRIAEFNLDVLRGTSTPTSQFEDDEEGSQNNESAE